MALSSTMRQRQVWTRVLAAGWMATSKRSMGGFSGGRDAMTYAKLAVREKEMRLIHRVAMAVAAKEVVSKARFQKIATKLGFRNKDGDMFLRKFRLMFELRDRSDSKRVVELTETMKRFMEEERRIIRQHEPYAVEVLRRLLMMAKDGKIPVTKLSILKPCFGFAEDFESTTLLRFPDFFTVTRNLKNEAVLELADWDPALAITAREIRGAKQIDPSCKDKFLEADPNSFRVAFENNCEMDRDRFMRLLAFQKRRFDSPYRRGVVLDDPDGSPEARKRIIAVCHEFLSLTVLKRANVRDIAILKEELQLPEDLARVLRRESVFFAMERLNNYYFVFLREAYHWDYQLELSPYIGMRRKYVELALISRKKRPLKRSLLPMTDPRRGKSCYIAGAAGLLRGLDPATDLEKPDDDLEVREESTVDGSVDDEESGGFSDGTSEEVDRENGDDDFSDGTSEDTDD